GWRCNRVVMPSETVIRLEGEERPGAASTGGSLAGRRCLVFALNGASFVGLGLAMARLLGAGGWSWPSVAMLILFLAGLPWTLMAFWNSVIGFVIRRLVADPAGFTNSALRAAPTDGPIHARAAICPAIRHEDVARVFARLEAMIESLAATAWSRQFEFHLLSDSSRSEIAAAEEDAVATLRLRHPRPGLLHYRRRSANI